MDKSKEVLSLQEIATTKLAIHLSQDSTFKEIAMLLEKPKYSSLFSINNKKILKTDPFESQTKNFESEKDYREYVINRWDWEVDEQCKKLTDGLNRYVEPGVHALMNRIALELLSFIRRQEAMLGIPRYYWMDFLTHVDWTESCQLDEMKIAEKLLKDERLTIFQRYRYACANCLLQDILGLREKLTRKEKKLIKNEMRKTLLNSLNSLIYIWTFEYQSGNVIDQNLLIAIVRELVNCGNLAVMMPFWKMLPKPVQEQLAERLAFASYSRWQNVQDNYANCRSLLVINNSRSVPFLSYYLPSYYSKLMYFFISEMNEDKRLSFFERDWDFAFQSSALKCLLYWPLQDYFLPTIRKLRDNLSMRKFQDCIFTLVNKYSGDYVSKYVLPLYQYEKIIPHIKENRYYDYRSLLENIWNEAPENYKRCIFNEPFNRHMDIPNSTGLFLRLSYRSPFQVRDEILFKNFFDYLTERKKIDLISNFGRDICSNLIERKRWSLVNWFLKQCLPKEEIASYKKQLVKARLETMPCFKSYHRKFLKHLVDWCFDLEAEKELFRDKMKNETDCLNALKQLLCNGNFVEVECLIHFSFSSDEMKELFKMYLMTFVCNSLLKFFEWKQMDNILYWCFGAKEKVKGFKRTLFSREGIQTHFVLLFQEKQLDKVKCFYEWFNLSHQEIEKVKVDTLFRRETIDYIRDCLYDGAEEKMLVPLGWCSTNEEIVINFREKMEKYLEDAEDEKSKEAKDRLHDTMNHVHEMTIRSSLVKDKPEKRSVNVKKRKFTEEAV